MLFELLGFGFLCLLLLIVSLWFWVGMWLQYSFAGLKPSEVIILIVGLIILGKLWHMLILAAPFTIVISGG